ncbi:MAG: RidA family protein [Acetobacteraceae bacterium]|nr:RidA family protein [Acetobacteraceae bacterium]
MERKTIDAADAPAAKGGYAQAVQIDGASRWLHVSGQIGVTLAGQLAGGFRAQCEQAWANLEAQLRAAGMTLDNLVKVTTILTDRRDAMESREVRLAVLGQRRVASTLVIAGLFDEAWLVEIEAVAAA